MRSFFFTSTRRAARSQGRYSRAFAVWKSNPTRKLGTVVVCGPEPFVARRPKDLRPDRPEVERRSATFFWRPRNRG